MDSTQRAGYRAQPARISEVLAKFIEPGPAGIARRYETAENIRLLWSQLLPPALAQSCRIVDLSQGILTVEADSPSFLYELRISSTELVRHLKAGCPSAKVRAIKVVLAR